MCMTADRSLAVTLVPRTCVLVALYMTKVRMHTACGMQIVRTNTGTPTTFTTLVNATDLRTAYPFSYGRDQWLCVYDHWHVQQRDQVQEYWFVEGYAEGCRHAQALRVHTAMLASLHA
jgi:hypothetical protein